MNVKEAVEQAKGHIKDLFAGEQISNLGLEEVEFDDNSKIWNVTIGFSRPWDTVANAFAAISRQTGTPNRSYKVVSIDDSTGSVRSVKNRETKSWAESA
jgi:hypothetical protein